MKVGGETLLSSRSRARASFFHPQILRKSQNPIDPAEFRSYHETGERPNANQCQRCGLSVFLNLEDVRAFLRHLWQNYPGKNYGPHIFKRNLTANDGKIKPTGNHGHHTWWAFEGIERHASFVFVETVPRA